MGKLNFDEIKELIKAIDETDITKFELNDEDYTINIEKEKVVEINHVEPAVSTIIERPAVHTLQPASAPVVEAAAIEETGEVAIDEGLETVVSPIVGTFYDSPSPDSDPYVTVGSEVKKGDVLCIVEAMKIMNEIKSEYDGVVEQILLENEDIVEYGQHLMLIRSK